jgi:cytochrome c peroxidase
MRTNNQTLDVGTGGAYQVPSLVGVGSRAPYMHDGRAATLKAAIHRHTGENVSSGEVADVITYLGTL